MPASAKADRIVVDKTAHQLTLVAGDATLGSYRIAIGRGNPGAKERQGDAKTPEGHYLVTAHNAGSAWHRSLRISYPDAADRARAAAGGFDPGGDIMIHGMRPGLGWIGSWHRLVDWTSGCIAVTDDEIDELWRVVDDGTPIEIRP